jgi:hypothetical protein
MTAAQHELVLYSRDEHVVIRLIEGNREHVRPGTGRRKRGSLQSSINRK